MLLTHENGLFSKALIRKRVCQPSRNYTLSEASPQGRSSNYERQGSCSKEQTTAPNSLLKLFSRRLKVQFTATTYGKQHFNKPKPIYIILTFCLGSIHKRDQEYNGRNWRKCHPKVELDSHLQEQEVKSHMPRELLLVYSYVWWIGPWTRRDLGTMCRRHIICAFFTVALYKTNL